LASGAGDCGVGHERKFANAVENGMAAILGAIL
jgi:hypothetical protein